MGGNYHEIGENLTKLKHRLGHEVITHQVYHGDEVSSTLNRSDGVRDGDGWEA